MSEKVREAVKRAIERERLEKLAHEKIMAEEKEESWMVKMRKNRLITEGAMRPATPQEYAEWLQGFLERGGEITHVYNYNMPDNFFIALRSFSIPKGACGALSFHVIVPKGIKVDHEGFDHCYLYPLDYGKLPNFVPLYSDVKHLLK